MEIILNTKGMRVLESLSIIFSEWDYVMQKPPVSFTLTLDEGLCASEKDARGHVRR